MTSPDRITASIRFPFELHAELVQAAQEEDRTLSNVVRIAARDYITRRRIAAREAEERELAGAER